MSQTPPSQVPPAPGSADSAAMDAKEIEDGKVLAILGYITGIAAIVVLIMRSNSFALYHAKQWLMLLVAYFVMWIPLVIVTVLVTVMAPKAGGCVMMVLYPLLWLGILVLVIIGVINAAQGHCKPLPLIGQSAETLFKGIRKQGSQGDARSAETPPASRQTITSTVYLPYFADPGPAPVPTNGLAIAGFICALVGLCVPPVGLVGLVLSAIGLSRLGNRGLAIAGLVLGILSVAGWLLWIMAYSAQLPRL